MRMTRLEGERLIFVSFVGIESLDTADPNKSGVTGSIGAPSVANLQTFLDTFVCQANQNQTVRFNSSTQSRMLTA